MTHPGIHLLGDAAVVVTFGEELSDEINDRVMALDASIRERPLQAPVRDVVPAIASLAVYAGAGGATIEQLIEELAARARELAQLATKRDRTGSPLHEIPVRYGGADGPDLADVAAFAGVSSEEAAERHAARVYRVFMLGFLPGFAYLGHVDPSIAAPRRATPRQDVPAGSIGIAGRQTGVYPQVSPGGWQLIGRTNTRMFDVATGRSLLQPGDRVRFVPERA